MCPVYKKKTPLRIVALLGGTVYRFGSIANEKGTPERPFLVRMK
jgi:hypothetical protein